MAAAKKSSAKSTAKESKAAKAPTFEEGLGAIEARIRELESGDLSLEKSIEAYEKAMQSLKSCYALLNQAEGKIAMLTKGAQGSTEGGDYDIESGSASGGRDLAVNPKAEVFDEESSEDEFEEEFDDDDEDDEEEEHDVKGKLPF